MFKYTKADCLSFFERYKEAKQLGFGAWTYYDALCREWGTDFETQGKKIKTLCTDPEKRSSIYMSVKIQLLKELKEEKVRARMGGKTSQADAIDEALKDFDSHPTLMKKTKEAYIKYFFDLLIGSGLNL